MIANTIFKGVLLKLLSVNGLLQENTESNITNCIPVRGRIKETAWVDNLVIPQYAGWITSYPPVVNGYVIQTLNTKLLSLEITVKLFQVLYNLVCNR